jgi:hypothetical protein
MPFSHFHLSILRIALLFIQANQVERWEIRNEGRDETDSSDDFDEDVRITCSYPFPTWHNIDIPIYYLTPSPPTHTPPPLLQDFDEEEMNLLTKVVTALEVGLERHKRTSRILPTGRILPRILPRIQPSQLPVLPSITTTSVTSSTTAAVSSVSKRLNFYF